MKKRFSEEQIIQILREAETNGNNVDIARCLPQREGLKTHVQEGYQRV